MPNHYTREVPEVSDAQREELESSRGARIARKSDRAVVSARADYGFRLSRSGEPPTYRYYRGDLRV